jgi:hypothetical protein
MAQARDYDPFAEQAMKAEILRNLSLQEKDYLNPGSGIDLNATGQEAIPAKHPDLVSGMDSLEGGAANVLAPDLIQFLRNLGMGQESTPREMLSGAADVVLPGQAKGLKYLKEIGL